MEAQRFAEVLQAKAAAGTCLLGASKTHKVEGLLWASLGVQWAEATFRESLS